jgi:hypothetical protein
VKDIPNFNKFFLFFKVCSIYFKELLSFLHHLVYLHSLIYQFALHRTARLRGGHRTAWVGVRGLRKAEKPPNP